MANWLTRLWERKASQFGAMLVRMSLGQAQWPERSPALFARDGYARNIVAHACIKLVAQSAAAVPWCLYDGDKEIEGHELLNLLAKPNPMTDGTAHMEAWYSFLQIAGNSYMERVDGLGRRPQELYVLRPDRVKVVPGADGFPQGYEFAVDGATRRVAVDLSAGDIPILHVRTFNPLSDWYGLSPLEPAAWAIDTHSGAGAFNKALLDNSAVPSGAVVVQADKEGDASLSEDQRERLKQELEARFTGVRNAGRPLILEGGLDWKAFGFSPEALQLIEGKREAAREIALAFGVPPMMLGIPGDNTYSNYQEANKAFWKHTVIPLARRGARAFTGWLCPAYGANLRLEPNLDDLDALADERAQQWTRIEQSTLLTLNEKRHALGYQPVAGGDVILVSAAMIPLETATTDVTGGPAPAK
jgi:HK97 family phage portal protein